MNEFTKGFLYNISLHIKNRLFCNSNFWNLNKNKLFSIYVLYYTIASNNILIIII